MCPDLFWPSLHILLFHLVSLPVFAYLVKKDHEIYSYISEVRLRGKFLCYGLPVFALVLACFIKIFHLLCLPVFAYLAKKIPIFMLYQCRGLEGKSCIWVARVCLSRPVMACFGPLYISCYFIWFVFWFSHTWLTGIKVFSYIQCIKIQGLPYFTFGLPVFAVLTGLEKIDEREWK